MLRSGAAQVDNDAKLSRVTLEQCGRVEPKARKNHRPEQSVLAHRLLHQRALVEDKPEDVVRLDRAHNILEDTGLLIVTELRPEVQAPGCLGNLNYQLRGPADETFASGAAIGVVRSGMS